MAKGEGSINISAELSALKHKKNNQGMRVLPPNTTIQRRPLYHPPVASPTAGAHVQKVVYVSSHTPILSAVKRVKKLLSHIEKRAIQSVDAKGQSSGRSMAELAQVSDQLMKTNEEVLVKASGRAMSQALIVGEWFRTKEKEMNCKVEVRTGSVQAVDDIVEAETSYKDDEEKKEIVQDAKNMTEDSTVLTGGETTMELLGPTTNSAGADGISKPPDAQDDTKAIITDDCNTDEKKKKRVRRKRPAYNIDDVPEARIRWIKYVEIAISLKA